MRLEIIKTNTNSSIDKTKCIPECCVEFEYKGKYYKIVFKTTRDIRQTDYGNETEIHADELDVYFEFLDEILK